LYLLRKKSGEEYRGMIVVQESAADYEISKPVICPKCTRGRIGNIPEWSEAVLSRRGKPPPNEQNEGIQVKCPICRALWTLTIE
jgi:hypothetical protein